MKLLEPDYTNKEWNIRSADNRVRAVLSKRHDIHHYYTSLEAYSPELGDGIWKHVPGSTVGHSTDYQGAQNRVAKLADGEWKILIKNI